MGKNGSIFQTTFQMAGALFFLAVASEILLVIISGFIYAGFPSVRPYIITVDIWISLVIWSITFLMLFGFISRYLLASLEKVTRMDLDRDGEIGSVRGWKPTVVGPAYNPAVGIVSDYDPQIEEILKLSVGGGSVVEGKVLKDGAPDKSNSRGGPFTISRK